MCSYYILGSDPGAAIPQEWGIAVSPDVSGHIIHLESMAIISQFPAAFSPPSFWCGFCPHVCCPQDFNMPFHLQHLVHIQEETKKVDVCIRLAKNIPQILRSFGSCPVDQNLRPGPLFAVNESVKGEFYLEILHPSIRLRFGY